MLPRVGYFAWLGAQAEYTKLSQPNELGPTFEVKYEREEPWGTFHDLTSERRYHVWVVQDPKQEASDRAKMSDRWKRDDAKAKDLANAAEAKLVEGCSCVDGMPCMDPYVCLDWYNRVAVATANGFNPAAGKVWKM